MSTLIVRPQPESGYTPPKVTVDGLVYRGGVNESWATLIAGDGTYARTNGYGTGQENALEYTGVGGSNYSDLARFILTLDTSALGAGAEISGATLYIYGSSKADPASAAPNINVYGATPELDNNLEADDYLRCGSTPYCDTPISYAGFSITGYNAFAFNATGLAAINKTGITRLSLRNANYDVAATPPAYSGDHTLIEIHTADYAGTDHDPYLEITYTIPITTNTVMFGTNM